MHAKRSRANGRREGRTNAGKEKHEWSQRGPHREPRRESHLDELEECDEDALQHEGLSCREQSDERLVQTELVGHSARLGQQLGRVRKALEYGKRLHEHFGAEVAAGQRHVLGGQRDAQRHLRAQSKGSKGSLSKGPPRKAAEAARSERARAERSGAMSAESNAGSEQRAASSECREQSESGEGSEQ